ncbi:hypothetical protein I3F58_06980 [Streptomyces sp. MUM 203J]|uniref:hypothetical protein n=1 Tax=Streptomyces sp. MUM 203J TaxID=2791990 RepID=UPI001F04065C|nr:hypothetical protein [Streptomyces sp. MUM 203J]MCH0539307.1 hypothetical protein [Streptomyces sp. MUM 203J]
MTKTKRALAALALAAGASALSAPAAQAGVVPGGLPVGPGGPSVLSQVDNLSASQVSPEYQGQVPRITEQFGGLAGVQQLGQLRQLVEPVAPVMGLAPGIRT